MNNIKKRLSEIIYIIENRPGFIFIGDFNYGELKYFLYGYLLSIDEELKPISINVNFTKWLAAKHKRQSSFLWMDYIYRILANEEDKKAIDILLKEFKEYVDSLV